MKILWICNLLFPEAEYILTGKGELKSSGGWMLGAAGALMAYHDVELNIACVSPYVDELTILNGEKSKYYIIPFGKGNKTYNKEFELYWKRIYEIVKPDLIHIHGTEYAHGLAYIKACGNDNVVISVQGLKSVISRYYDAGLTKYEIIKKLTFRDLIRGGISCEKKRFYRAGLFEHEMIKCANYVMGRTSWDKSHVCSINPGVNYFKCNEILRDEFYEGSFWNYSDCLKHSIFLSQAGYPVKGLHQMLKALPMIQKSFPDVTVRIAGDDITRNSTLLEKIRLSGYGKIILNLIKKYQLKDKVNFIGNLSASNMKREYMRANVFVCPSSIENSPNSLGEAQILGTPCVASYAGGIPDMMKGNEENLYRFEEVEMLADKICNIFSNKENQIDMKSEALRRHNVRKNSEQLFRIYNSIIKKECL